MMRSVLWRFFATWFVLIGTAKAATIDQLFAFSDESSGVAQFALTGSSVVTNIQFLDPLEGDSAALVLSPSEVSAGVWLLSGEIDTRVPGNLSFLPTSAGSATAGSITGGDGSLTANLFRLGLDEFDDVSWSISNQTLKVLFSGTLLGSGEFTLSDVSAVPIPAAGIMLLSALVGLLIVGRRGRMRARRQSGGGLASV